MSTVSIIIPIYNVELYIRQCLQSVMDQTLTGGLECILVDDCGQDKSMDIAQQMVDEYNGNIDFRIIHHEKNRGLSAARNTGIDLATGEYIAFIDSDDELPNISIEIMLEEVKKHPQIELVQGYTKSVPDMNYYHTERYNQIGYKEDNFWIRNEFYKTVDGFPCNAWNKIIKTTFLKNNRLYFKEGIIYEDQHWMFYLVKKLNRYSIVSQETYIHYRRENSIMGTNSYYSQLSNRNWAIILSDIIPNIDRICQQQQIKRYICELVDRCNYSRRTFIRPFFSFLLILLKTARFRSAFFFTIVFCIGRHRGMSRSRKWLYSSL